MRPDLAKYNGFLTAHNPESGGHRTFRISTAQRGNLKGSRIIGLLSGPNNTSDYKGFGFVEPDGSIRTWRKLWNTKYDRLAQFLNNADKHPEIEFSFSTRCRVCNRELTDPISIELGIGPICRGEK